MIKPYTAMGLIPTAGLRERGIKRRFCLGQPESHVHVAVHGDRRGLCGPGLLCLSGLAIQQAETTEEEKSK